MFKMRMFDTHGLPKRGGRKRAVVAAGVGLLGLVGVPAAQAAEFSLATDRCAGTLSKVFCLSRTSGLDWNQAQQYAAGQTLGMRSGRLATVANADENLAVQSLFGADAKGAWLDGSAQYTGDPATTVFSWSPRSIYNRPISQLLNPATLLNLNSPEPLTYDNWDRTNGSLEPNFYEGETSYGILAWGNSPNSPAENWHDLPTRYDSWGNESLYAVVEFDRSPEPTASEMLLMAAAAAQAASQVANNPAQPQDPATIAAAALATFQSLAQNYDFAPLLTALGNLSAQSAAGAANPTTAASQQLLGALAQGGAPVDPATAGQQLVAAVGGASPAVLQAGAGSLPNFVSMNAPQPQSNGSPTAVPTPALLPGLVGFFWKVKRKKMEQA